MIEQATVSNPRFSLETATKLTCSDKSYNISCLETGRNCCSVLFLSTAPCKSAWKLSRVPHNKVFIVLIPDAFTEIYRMICILVLCYKGEKTSCATSVESLAVGIRFPWKCQQGYDIVRARERQWGGSSVVTKNILLATIHS